jgi:hypothetical protein
VTVIRTTYEDLPSIVRTQVEELTGPVRHVTAASAGLNSAVAATLHTNGEAFFIKALPADARWVWTQQREAEIAPYVRTVSANFVGRIVAAGWMFSSSARSKRITMPTTRPARQTLRPRPRCWPSSALCPARRSS